MGILSRIIGGKLLRGLASYPGSTKPLTVSSTGQLGTGDYAASTRSIVAGTGLTGGGDLSADRTLTIDFAPSGESSTTKAVRADDSRLGGGVPHHPGYKAGRYYSSTPCSSVGTSTLTANRLHYFPFPVITATTWTRIGFSAYSGAGAGVNVRLGVYASSDGCPTSLVSDSGYVAVATTGDKEITIDLLLQAGWHWLAALPSASISVWSENAATAGSTGRIDLGAATGSGSHGLYWYESRTYGALPSSASGTLSEVSGANYMPRIWLRKGV